MNFRTDLYAYLTADNALTAIVGDRIYPGFAPSSAARPYIVYTRIASTSTHNMGTRKSAPDGGMMRDVFQFDIYAESEYLANEIKIVLLDMLNGLEVEMGDTHVRRIFLNNQVDAIEPPSDGKNDAEYRETVEFTFWYLRGSTAAYALLQENAFFLTLEDEGKILLEAS